MTFYPSEQPTPWLPLLIADMSLEHSHRRTAVVVDDDGSTVEIRQGRSPRPRRRLVGVLAATGLAVGLLAASVGAVPAAPVAPNASLDPGFRLGPGLAQPPGYMR
jgi:hypothetical protein